jgi:Ankyrin repeats (3 copies)
MIPKVVERNAEGQTLFHIACSEGDLDRVKSLLEYGSDINAADNAGWTPAHNASLHGNDKVLALLLKYGSAIDPIGMEGETPLHDAVANGHAKCVNLLLKYGADVLRKNAKGKTPRDLVRADHEDIKRLVNFPREHWEPIMHTEFYPRLLRDSSKIPEDVEESVSAETVKETLPSQNNSFSWGGLDHNGTGDFESEREKKKFQALLKTLSQAERDALEGNKSEKIVYPQPRRESVSKDKEPTTTPRPRGRPPGAKNIKPSQKASSNERKSVEPKQENGSAVKRGSAGPISEPKRSKTSM